MAAAPLTSIRVHVADVQAYIQPRLLVDNQLYAFRLED
jgi:hypothetical protein